MEAVLGAGGMGVVYRVNQIFLDQEFALKTLIREQISEVRVRRFQKEARAAYAVDHPNIIAVKDFGILDNMTPFLVMELIHGETLADRLQREGRLTAAEALPIFIQACFGLAYAHERGIVHRDIKPSNIMLLNGIACGAEAAVKIVDFGIAKFAQHDGGEVQALTKTGEVFGSPLYMSPEQCAGERVDHRADVYSLGCVLFEALTGTPPCVGENALSTMMQHQTALAPTLKEASLGLAFSPELEEIVATMLAKSPEKRYQNLGVVAHYLAALNRGESISHGVKLVENTAHANSKKISISMANFYASLLGVGVIASVIAGSLGYSLSQFQQRSNLDSATAQDSASHRSASNRVPDQETPSSASIATVNSDSEKQSRAPGRTPESHSAVFSSPVRSGPRAITGFSFPKNICIGILKIDQQPPMSVWGEKSVSKNCRLGFYTRHPSADFPALLDKFRNDDLNALEAVFHKPEQVVEKVKKWTRLDELLFFNSLMKAPPQNESHEESPVSDKLLPEIDKLTRLKSLGLCGELVTGTNIAKMSLLRSLHSIKLKGIKNAEPLLKALPHYPNIEEVWLIEQGTDNHQLELLTHMKNLKTLRIRRSALNPDSLAVFARMKNLKHLVLDKNNWSAEEKERFKRQLPDCQFEPVIDIHYWLALPDQPLVPREGAVRKQSEMKTDEDRNAKNNESLEQIVYDFGAGRRKINISQVVTHSEELKQYGATPKEIRMIENYPFEQIQPQETEFAIRFAPYLKQSTMWSH